MDSVVASVVGSKVDGGDVEAPDTLGARCGRAAAASGKREVVPWLLAVIGSVFFYVVLMHKFYGVVVTMILHQKLAMLHRPPENRGR